MDGIAATQQIRQSQSKVPILALSAHAMKTDKEKCMEAGTTFSR
jgi:CheY-like chemotaxis protein